jgi:undecaprenyl pyrophosphate phosphatase UppP
MDIILDNVLNNLAAFLFMYLAFKGGKFFVKNQKYNKGIWESYLYYLVLGSLLFAFLGFAVREVIDKNSLSSSITFLILYLVGFFVGYTERKKMDKPLL